MLNGILNKNAFQWDAYRPHIDRVWGGGSSIPGGGGFSIPGGSSIGGGFLHRGGGIPCDLSHNAFDVTCMLPPHQLRHINCAAAYIVWPRCMLGYIPPPPVDRITDTCKNITFPQLRLREVTNTLHYYKTAWSLNSTFVFQEVKKMPGNLLKAKTTCITLELTTQIHHTRPAMNK